MQLGALELSRQPHPVNKAGGSRAPTVPGMERFAEILQEHNIAATLRISKGQDIAAGCGQLKVPEGRAAEKVGTSA